MRCLVLQHVAFESLGVFAGPLEEAGYTVSYVQAGLAPLDKREWLDAELAVILGGPIGVDQVDVYPFLRLELDLTKARLASGRPLLGVCLGAQLMAAALGARVYAGRGKEIGWGALELTPAGQRGPLAELEDAPVLHWHGDTFDLPAGTELLASSAMTPHQAFRAGRGQLALQFHPEADATRMETWLIGHCCELAQAGLDPRRIREDALRLGAAARRAGQAFFRRWLAEETV
ncbi:glutamine amidotransferase [Desulfovibrio sp. PG-178-WT-4]|uniref:Glutamine amidotransferase n=1 Tax=Desulfovibrio porci TaxID=2605782 RepID=A0A6L5XM19_9BACT|nr:glutamine amidotransferase [Desulfovibrio porci]MDY3810058.1 glutamine amidotransferase [Desulfovibrio porci]MSS27871.1 glutamine amidotransferase [Desulfovibrio porci]